MTPSTALPDPPVEPSPEDVDSTPHGAGSAVVVEADVQLGGKLAGLSLPRQVAMLAIWPFLQQVLAFLVNFVDTAIAGRLSVEATNAIAIAAYFGWFLFLMTSAVGTGGAALIARAVGARHRGLANAGLGQSFVLALIWAGFIGTLVFVGADFIGGLAQLEGESRELCAQYLRIIAVAAPATAVLAIGTACLSAAGDTRTPFLAMLVFNVVNVAVSVVLAVSPWRFTLLGEALAFNVPGLGLGVPGIAWGTSIATVVGALLILIALINPAGPIRLRWLRMRPHLHTVRRIIRVALPSLGEGVGHWSGNFIALIAIGFLGQMLLNEAYPGAHIVAIRIEALSFLPAMALATAAGTLTGQYLGAGSVLMAKKAAIACWLTAVIPMTLLGVTFIAVPQWWVGIVSTQPEHFELSPRLIQICGFVQFFFGSSIVLSGAMRGAGDTRRPMLMTVGMTWGVRLPLVLLVTLWLSGTFDGVPKIGDHQHSGVAWLGSGLAAVWCILCGELVLRGCVFMVVFFRGNWARVEV
ncbi:MAG: MATE family efflux transporter [Planctomycetota bacterium]